MTDRCMGLPFLVEVRGLGGSGAGYEMAVPAMWVLNGTKGERIR